MTANVTKNPDIGGYYRSLYTECGEVLLKSLTGDLKNYQIQHHNFIVDYVELVSYLSHRPEWVLFKRAASEYQFALLALVLGQYRQSFAALRLFFELTLAAVYFSANEFELREWLRGDQDIKWSTLKDSDKGIFSKRFARAFLEVLVDIAPQYGAIAERVYRECSEYVHGNAYTHGLVPGHIDFSESMFLDWHSKAKSIRLVVCFALVMRYVDTFEKDTVNKLEPIIIDELVFHHRDN